MALSPQTIGKMQRFLLDSRPENPDPVGAPDAGILSTPKSTSSPGILSEPVTKMVAGPEEKSTEQPMPAPPPPITYGGPSANTAPGHGGILEMPAAPTPPATPTTPTTPAPTTPTPAPTGINTAPGTSNSSATQLNASQLANRVVDPNELVRNQLTGILGENNEFISNEEAAAQRAVGVRGLTNSTMAASAGREAAIRAAMPIAQADAATYGKVADYNTALSNQAYMYNVDAENNFKKLGLQIDADKAMQDKAVAAQLQSAGISSAASMHSAGANLEAARISAETSRLNALLNAQTQTNNQDSQNKTSIYNQKLSLANNIMQNMEFSPDYKRSLLNGLGPEFALLATNVFLDGTMAADLTGQSPSSGTGMVPPVVRNPWSGQVISP